MNRNHPRISTIIQHQIFEKYIQSPYLNLNVSSTKDIVGNFNDVAHFSFPLFNFKFKLNFRKEETVSNPKSSSLPDIVNPKSNSNQRNTHNFNLISESYDHISLHNNKRNPVASATIERI